MPLRNVSIQRPQFISGGCYNQENKKLASRIKGVGFLRYYKNNLPKFLVNKTNRCIEFQFYWYYYSTCFGFAFRSVYEIVDETQKPRNP